MSFSAALRSVMMKLLEECFSVSATCSSTQSALCLPQQPSLFLKSTCRLSGEFVGQWTNKASPCQPCCVWPASLRRFNLSDFGDRSVQRSAEEVEEPTSLPGHRSGFHPADKELSVVDVWEESGGLDLISEKRPRTEPQRPESPQKICS